MGLNPPQTTRLPWQRFFCCVCLSLRPTAAYVPRQRSSVFRTGIRSSCHTVGAAPCDDSGKQRQTALVWLRTSLRLEDNKAVREGIEHGPDGLTIVFVWERGAIPLTPSAAFECAAARQLDQQLRAKGNLLKIIDVNSHNNSLCSISLLRNVIEQLQVQTVVVDANSSENGKEPSLLQKSLATNPRTCHIKVVSITEDGSLLPFALVPKALGRSRYGGRVLRWPTFLSNMSKHCVETPIATPDTIPKPVNEASDSLPIANLAGAWAASLLETWGEVSEKEALRRAQDCQHAQQALMTLGYRDVVQVDSRLSPYLRWGIISPRQAYHLGVRKRDLLWRDWSHMCYRHVNALRKGEPALRHLDGCYFARDCRKIDENDLFLAWCRGETGYRMIDAGMRQLWCEGWMPRHVRLLVANFLVEGLGIDWRKGRDWFRYTLVDHDPAINELMWQNAGFCGIDLFYRGLNWDVNNDGNDYIQQWASKTLELSPTLSKQLSLSNEHISEVVQSHREELKRRNLYGIAAKVANSGVRVLWDGLVDTEESSSSTGPNPGDVWGIGLDPLGSLR